MKPIGYCAGVTAVTTLCASKSKLVRFKKIAPTLRERRCTIVAGLKTSRHFFDLFLLAATRAEEVRHDLGAFIAGMIQAGEPETRLQRLEQGKMRVEVGALHAVNSVVGVHD